jgi:dCTP deaminase
MPENILNDTVGAKGAFPIQWISDLMKQGVIKNASERNLNPASIDLALSEEIFRLDGLFQPRPTETVREIIKELNPALHNFAYPLERNVTYLVRLKEIFALPSHIYAYCNPKSTTGRNGIQVRVVADHVSRYDSLPNGFNGEAWLSITPKSYPIKLCHGDTLAQVRFFNQDTRLTEEALPNMFDEKKLLWSKEENPFVYSDIKIKDNDGAIVLTLDLDGDICGWECLGVNRILDFSKLNYYAPRDFFRPVIKYDGRVQLREGALYIFYTKERVCVPPSLACEMHPMDHRSGEFRSHDAGFIDPGYGYGPSGKAKGRRLVLEVRPFEDIVFRNGQPAAKIKFETMAQEPNVQYDSLGKSNYTDESETPRLAKNFKKE